MSSLGQKNQKNTPLPSASLSILKKQYESKQIRAENAVSKPSSEQISVVELIRMAIEAVSQNSVDHLPFHQSKDLELALGLETAALYFSRQHFTQARNLLGFVQQSACQNGSPLERVLFYFGAALQEGILAEMGEIVPQQPHQETEKHPAFEETFAHLQTAMLQCHETLPFCRVTQFTAIQAIVDNVGPARRVHLVDLGIKSGSQWAILMQALASRPETPLEFLKITAVGSSKEVIEEIGKKLSAFAEGLRIPFAFNVVVSDLKSLDRDFFKLNPEETLAVYSELSLATLLGWPHHLESLLHTIRKLNPKVMVAIEIDSNTNTTAFLDRFNASLSVSSAMFDCLEVCMDRGSKSRAILEGVFMREGIRYLVTSKGEESIHRQESVGFWRDLLKKVGMKEVGLSNCALYQATLMTQSNPCWSFCTIEMSGNKGITVGWKGTPVHFLGVWKC